MRVYHFLNRKYGLENIAHRHMKVSLLDKVNDPFELLGVALADQKDRQIFHEWRATMALHFGMICFSRSWRNPVQWSHYADRHMGFCLGFEVNEPDLQRVIYQAHRPALDLKVSLANGTLTEDVWLGQVICRKFAHWRYEQEMRMWIDLLALAPTHGGHRFVPFSEKMALREVFIGAEATTTRSDVTTALGELGADVSVICTRLAFKRFGVCKQLDKNLWR